MISRNHNTIPLPPSSGLPPIMGRKDIEALIERLIWVLDAMDGDPDFEPEADDEPNGDDEPWLGSITSSAGFSFPGGCDDLEVDHDFQ